METYNWFPINRCLYFPYYNVHVKLTGCQNDPTTNGAFNNEFGLLTKNVYNDSACTVVVGAPSTFSYDCSMPSPSFYVDDTYLTQCVDATATDSSTSSSNSCSDEHTVQTNAILGLTSISFILLIITCAIAVRSLFQTRPVPNEKDALFNRSSL